MANLWVFRSLNLNMFVSAADFGEARQHFKILLFNHIQNTPSPLLDELIEISCLGSDGTFDDLNSHIEFTEIWLRELGVPMDIINIGV
jgi:hypothetical protein